MASLGDLFVTVGAKIDGFKAAMTDVSSTLTKTADTGDAATAKIAEAFGSLGVKMSAAGIGAFLIKTGTDFQAATNLIQKETGKTGEALSGLEDSFKRLYANSSRSAEEIAGGLSKLAVETKLSGSSLEALTAANLRFAKVTSSDLNGAMEQTQVVFKQFGISAADQSDALDVLYTATTETGISVAKLTEQMAAVGPTARAFGMSFVETSALVAAFEEAGLQASDVTRGLNSLLVKFAEAGKEPKKALAELLEKLKDSSSETAALNELIGAGFAKRAAVAMADAARRGALDIAELTKKLSESKGKVKEIADQTSSFKDELKKLGHEAEIVGASLGEPIVKVFTDIFKAIRVANDEFAKFQQGIKGSPVPAFIGATMSQGLQSIGRILNNTFNPFAPGNYINNFLNPSAPVLPGAPNPLASALTAGVAGTGGGGNGIDLEAIKKAFAQLGLKDLNKELTESVAAFQKLAGAGLLTHDQVMKAALAIQKLRNELKPAFVGPVNPAFGVEEAAKGITWGAKDPTIEQLRNLPLNANVFDLPTVTALHRALSDLNGVILDQANALDADARNAGYLTDAFHHFGLKTRDELVQDVKDSEDAFAEIRDSGVDAPEVIGMAWAQMFKAKLALQLRDKTITKEQYDELIKETDAAFGKLGASGQRAARTLGQEFSSMTHQMFDGMERGLANAIVNLKGFADLGKAILKEFAAGGLEILFKGLFKPLEDKLASILGHIGGGVSGAASGAAGAAGSAGGAASTGAAGAASGVMGTIGAVSAAVGAVSSVIGNFQMAGMNKSLDVLVNHTLRIFNELANFRQDAWTREPHLMRKLDDIWNSIRNIGGAGAAGNMDMLASIRDYARLTVSKFDEFVIPKMDVMIGQMTMAGALAGGGVYVDLRGSSFSGVTEDLVDELGHKIVRSIRAAGGKQ